MTAGQFSIRSLLVLMTIALACVVCVGLLQPTEYEARADDDGTVPLQVRIANVRGLVGVGREYPRAQLQAVVTNVSRRPVQIWDQWNSWGYHNLTLSLEFGNGDTKELRRFGGIDWSQNDPMRLS